MNINLRNTQAHPPKAHHKHKAQSLIHQLTLLSPSLDYLENPISRSNQYIASKTEEIKKLNGMKPIVVRVYAYMFKLQRDQIYEQLTNFTTEIENSVNKANQLITDLSVCVKQLNLYTCQIDDLNTKNDYLGIVSVNNLKIATIEQKIAHCKQQIDHIDKFRTVTLHHINDSVLLNNSTPSDTKEYESLSNYFHKHEVLRKRVNKNMFRSGFVLLGLAALNYLTSTYHLIWTSTEYKEKVVNKISSQSPPDALNSLSVSTTQMSEAILSTINILQYVGLILALPLFCLGALSLMRDESNFSYFFLAILLSLAPFFVSILLNGFFDSDEPDIVSIPYEVTNTIDFLSFGLNGSLLMLSLSLLCFASIFAFKAFSSTVDDAYALFSKLPSPLKKTDTDEISPA